MSEGKVKKGAGPDLVPAEMKRTKLWPDWAVRALKTFVQAFFGVLLPEAALILRGGWPESWAVLWAALSPVTAAALAGAISAVWNLILEAGKG